MSKKVKFLATAVFTSVLAYLVPVTSLAMKLQSDLYYDPEMISSGNDELSGVVAILFFGIWCFVIIFSLVMMVIWVLSIIDIVKRENWKSENDKIMWLLLVVFINVVSLYYYFFYRKTLDKTGNTSKVDAPVTPKA